MVMPVTKVNITGVLSRFANDVQIMPRSLKDIQPYDGLDYESTWAPTQPEGDGSAAKPFNVAAAIAKCQEVGTSTSSEKYYIKGYVVADAEASAQYGNITFELADSKDGGVRFTAYQMAGSDGKKLPSGYKVSKGDEVVICGKVVNYNGSKPETEGQGKSIIVSVNGKDTKGTSVNGGGNNNDNNGGDDTPSVDAQVVTIAQFNAAAVSNDVWYQLTGTIKNLKDGDQYGNFDIEDASGSVYVYGLLATKGGEKKKFQDLVTAKGIANGKKITIIGNRGEYNGKIEVLNAYFVSIE
jgi:DNA/RNA endonuclease YhcR with UshA esterase domain